MQTFLPLPDLRASMNCLDPIRLGNQIWRECKTIANGGWPHHPISKMWQGHLPALAEYALAGLDALASRSPSLGRGSGREYPHHRAFFEQLRGSGPVVLPPWFGDESFHRSHRSNLLRKDPAWYSQFGWTEPDDLPYVWFA